MVSLPTCYGIVTVEYVLVYVDIDVICDLFESVCYCV